MAVNEDSKSTSKKNGLCLKEHYISKFQTRSKYVWLQVALAQDFTLKIRSSRVYVYLFIYNI